MSKVIHISDISAFNKFISKGPAVVDFSAKWCPPCRMIAPHFDELSKNHPNVQFLHVDVDESQDIAMKYGIRAMPTFQSFRNGEKVQKFEGASMGQLKNMITSLE